MFSEMICFSLTTSDNQGVAPELRKEIWKYLLGYYKWNMSREEIKQHKKEKE